MSEDKAYEFWKNFDKAIGKIAIKDFAVKNGFDYIRIINQRSDCRLPKLEDAYALASALGVSVEYLLTGQGDSPPRNTANDDIISRLDIATPEECDMVRRMLGLTVHERKSIEA